MTRRRAQAGVLGAGLLVGVGAMSTAPAVSAPQGVPVPARSRAAGCDVRYVANAGVLFTSAGPSFLLDAPIREGIAPYATPDAAERQRLEGAEPPYRGITAILVTHWHEDHFSPDAVSAHLRRSPSTVLISSQEVVARVRQVWPDVPAAQVRSLTPAPGASQVTEIGGVRVHVLRLRHNPARRLPAEHVGFLVEGCRTLLHTGDADPQADNFAPLRRLPRPAVAVLPFWYVTGVSARQMVQVTINPIRVLAAHLPPSDAASVANQLAGLPWVTLLREPGQIVPLDRER